MNQTIANRILAFCAISTLAGCFSLLPMPGTGKKSGPPAKAEVDGKVFGTGTLPIEEWAVTLLVDPASVDVHNGPDLLRVSSKKGAGGIDPIYGGFELTMRKKRPGETAQSALAAIMKALKVGRSPGNYKAVFASFDIPAIEDQTSNGSFHGEIKVAERGNCLFELIIAAPDIEQMVRIELATRAGILARSGKTPSPAACQ